tara:strand:+ start:41 stop:271 length:231 start_codon:yes stop_codon:yes gene_type:complete
MSYAQRTERFLREAETAYNSLLGARHCIERAGWEMAERDDKIAELEAMIDKADAMYAEKVYELQQLQKSLIPQIQS